MTRPAVHVQRWTAFADDPDAGNPAGVALADALPDDATMLRVAAEVGYSETAFLAPVGAGAAATWDVRYVSPRAEVPFCGHATIAAGVALRAVDPGLDRAVLRTRRVGTVALDLEEVDGAALATLTSPPAHGTPLLGDDLRALLGLFGLGRGDLDVALPLEVAHAGADHPVLPLAERSTLAAMAYRFDDLRDLCVARGWTTVALVHRGGAATWHARNAFPVGGVVEDPATGAAAAALGGLLRRHGLLPVDGRFTVHQGDDMGRPSRLLVDASGSGGVRVGGTAVRIPG